MKIPQKPKDVQEILKNNHSKIFKLLEDKNINEFISKCNQEYIHWDMLRYKLIPNKANPEHVWALIKLFRNSQYRKLKFNNWHFQYVLLDEFQRKLHLLDMGTAGKLGSSLENISSSGREKYIISSLMEEAIASSQLEGAATTRRVAKEILRLKKKPKNFSEQMIVNGYQTNQKILKMLEKKITPEIILEIHRNITKDTLKSKDYEGRWRENNEVVVADPINLEVIYHKPPNYAKIPELMKEFCDFASNDEDFIHPILKGIMLHFLIGYIHPFEDGNGRTARAIFYWYVLSRGYWLFEFMAISRNILRSKVKYGLAYLYTETDDNDLTYFINYNLNCIEEALHDMETYIKTKQQEQSEALQLLKNIKNVNLRQAEILKQLIKEPEKSIVVSEIVNTYGVAYDTARNDLLYLHKLGYLDMLKVQKKFMFKLSQKKI